MLTPTYNYLFLDFETTGLDTTKDEPIQIGLLLIDAQGNTVNTYSSLIKPSHRSEELKTIVTYLTNKQLKDLTDAPSIESIFPDIIPFLQENTVLIGHNISFDLAILQRYIDRTPALTIDTFPLAKAFFHFLPSYALEVVHRHLPEKNNQQTTAHDALEDCRMTADVFLYCIGRFHTLRHQYAVLDYAIQQGDGIITKILKRTPKPYKFTDKELFFPPLRKPVPPKKKLLHQSAPITLPDSSSTLYYTGNTTLHEVCTSLPWATHQRVITAAHLPKLTIIKAILEQTGVSTSSLHDIRIFLPERVNLFLHKPSFDDAELLFIAKYLSHHNLAHTAIDINTAQDYKFFHTLTTTKSAEPGQIIVCSHTQWYQQPLERQAGTYVLFFDQDRRRHTRGDHLQTSFDPHQFLHYLEQKVYEYTLLAKAADAAIFQQILTAVTLFFGVFGAELNILFSGHAEKSLEIESIITHTRMPKTKDSFSGCTDLIQHLLTETHPDHSHLHMQRTTLTTLLHDTIIINKAMYAGDHRYYTFSSPKSFHTFDEFQEQLPGATYLFLSTRQSHLPSLFSTEKKHVQELKPEIISMKNNRKPQDVLAHALEYTTRSLYVLCTRKDISQLIFSYLANSALQQSHTLLAENITGGIGKTIFLAQQSTKPIVFIGGYMCYLQVISKKVPLAQVIPYFYEGKQKDLIFKDIEFWR